jgi:methyl-accepting chemotaxis protein
MKIGKNASIKRNVITGYVLLFLCCLACSVVGVVRITLINNSNKAIQQKAIGPIVDYSDIAVYVQKIAQSAGYIAYTADLDVVESEYKKTLNYSSMIDELVEDARVHSIDEADLEAFSDYEKSRTAVIDTVKELYELRKSGKIEEAYALYDNELADYIQIEADGVRAMAIEKSNQVNILMQYNIKSTAFSALLMILLLVLAAGMVVFLSFMVIKELNTLKQMVEVSKELATGNFDVEVKNEFEKNASNEIGQFSKAFRRLVLSGNQIIGSVIKAADQVEAGALQVSDSSMSLSQGTSEQASAIEELSTSLQNISSKVKENNESARHASELSKRAKVEADNGNLYMGDLVEAMKSIDESSKNISKVIKVIDDIAFQTNILALNAAVEAARAGQYGRGFAVVADEVRNLAAKSAAAVDETTVMIETSLSKIKVGNSKAELTAKAFNEILESVSELNGYGEKVATSSDEQTIAIDQINQGILQIADVVQSTSATAEETAAASEELSSQAVLLRKELSRFNVKNQATKSKLNKYNNSYDDIENYQKNNWNKIKSSNIHDTQNKVNSINLSDDEFGKY